ncbi:hypothetical protein [Halomonas sp. N3-2A]|uniref:hypothetical protein n=1 Tax=Halomonas sp. N3-2A TaxID=2014541 RepID=UPI0012FD5883|nr:hypothetical protein [Halomonas sp. N3-2A]
MPAVWAENTGGIGMLLALYLPWAMGKRQAAYRCTRINSLLARAQRAFLRHGLLPSRHARVA